MSLRSCTARERLKIVMVSANAHEYSAGGDEELHDAFVMKPIDIQVLLAAMESSLHLKWIYESTAANDDDDASLAAHRFSPQHIADLYQLGRIGHVRGIQTKLQEIESEHPANAAFAAHLRQLIDKFDFKRYMSALQDTSPHQMRQSSST